MPLTTLMTFIGSLVMIGSWAFIGHRIKLSPAGGSPQVRRLQAFFLCMGLFCLCIFVPNIALGVRPADFPVLMAWGYIVGHVCLYVGIVQVLRLTFSMVPRLASKEKYAVIVGVIALVAITALTVKTMAFGRLPSYDTARHITLFNVNAVVGALIAIFAAVSVFPAAILMVLNGIHNPSSRLRSFLLGSGLFIIMTAGPLHDVSRSWQLYMVADIVSILGLVVTASGVAYRLEERIGGPVVAQPTLVRAK